MRILENFAKVKVLVFGDIMLDRYWWGTVSRISPEAPVPVVNLDKTSLAAGGAANVAANVAGLGAKPYLIGIIGDDDEGKYFPEILNKSGISADHLVKVKNRPTTVKTRIIAHSQQIARLDHESNSELEPDEEELVWKKLESVLNEIHIIIVSDYAKGIITKNILARLIKKCKKKNIKIFVDPKGKNYSKYKGVTLLTPNKKEAAEACKLDESHKNLVANAGKQLISEIETEMLLITQGEDGMTLFEKKKKPFHIKALAKNVYDVTGAGDTVIATLAVAIGAGIRATEAAEIANISAGIVIEKMGTTAIQLDELSEELKKNKVLDF